MESKITALRRKLVKAWMKLNRVERVAFKEMSEGMRIFVALEDAFDLPAAMRPFSEDEPCATIVKLESEIMATMPSSAEDMLVQAIVAADRMVAPFMEKHEEIVADPAALVRARDAAGELVRQLELATGTTRKKLGLAIYAVDRAQAKAVAHSRTELLSTDAGGIQ